MLKEGPERCPGCIETFAGGDMCPHCGRPRDGVYNKAYLRPGVILGKGRYFTGDLVSSNGGGATYKGFDNKNRHTCWIREYFPTTLAVREPDSGRVMPMEGYEAQYKALISDFVDVCNEVKRCAVTENVIPILDGFAENNTLYAIYDHMDLIPYEEYLKQNGGKLSFAHAMEIFLPLCNMVGTIHDHGHIHRGISPHTVWADENGALYLWGFSIGAARTAGSELEAELFNGYSAPEQYSPNGWQGAWTDVYALAALFYRTVSGFVPPKSTLVGEDRRVASLGDLVADTPQNISDAVSKAMEVSAERRTQSVYSFTARLIDAQDASTAVYDTGVARRARPTEDTREKDGGFKYAVLALVFTAVTLLCGLLYVTKAMFPQMLGNAPVDRESSAPAISEPISVPEPESEAQASSQAENVPRFVGQMMSVIESDSNYENRFEFSVQMEFNDDFPEGVVVRQSPEEGTPMPNRGTVILYVSKGPELVEMPNIIGLDWDEALKALGEKNLPCEKLDRYTPGADPGKVVGTTPSPGAKFNPKKDSIIVYVMPQEPESSESSDEDASEQSGDSKPSSSSKSSSSKSAGSSKSSSSSKKSSQ